MSVLDDAVGQSFQHTPAVVPTVAAVPTQTEAASTQLPTSAAASAAAPATAASAAPSVLDNAISQSFTHTPPPVDTNSSKLEPAGAAGGVLKPQAEATTGIMNLIGRGAEIMLGHPKGSLTGTISSEQPLSTAGEVGQVAGDTAQWMASEGAVSKLGELAGAAAELADASKYIKTPVAWAEYLKQSPKAAWLLKAISGVAKGSATGAAIGAAQGAATGNAEQGAERGAAGGAIAGAVAPALEGAANKIPNPWAAARAAARGTAEKVAGTGVAKALTGSDIQPTLQTGIRDVWNQVADREGVPAIGYNVSIRDAGQQVGDYILDRSKTLYKQIDDATGNRFQPLADKIDAVNLKLRDVTNDKEEQDLLINKKRYELQLDQVFDDAEKKGISRDSVAQAKRDYKTAQAIFDTNAGIQNATTGIRPGMSGATTEPETVDPKSLMKRFNSLYNSGRLQQAVGDDAAEDMLGHSASASTATRKVARNLKIAGGLATAAGVGEAIRHAAPLVP